jgi:hypothetical protein
VKRECTEIFLRYREICRVVWNLGFWPFPELREIPCVLAYDQAMARVFEAMVLLPLGYAERITETPQGLGKIADFGVSIDLPETELLIDKFLPGGPYHSWGNPILRLPRGRTHQLKFVSFFDWNQLAPRDFRFLEVRIEGLDGSPEFIGHHALVELDRCSVWLLEQDEQESSGHGEGARDKSG